LADPGLDRYPSVPIVTDGLAILVWRPAHVTSVTAWSAASLDHVIELLGCERPSDGRTAVTGRWGRVWWTGPRRALVIADSADLPELAPCPDAAIHRETAAQVGFRVDGPDVRRLLARLVPIDLAERAFPVAGFATTRVRGVTVHLQRRPVGSRDGFDLLVPRSVGVFFAEILVDAARGLGIAVADEPMSALAVPRLSSREVFDRPH
jgi:heterotetrameric sarcosine oxidase gamma subunit